MLGITLNKIFSQAFNVMPGPAGAHKNKIYIKFTLFSRPVNLLIGFIRNNTRQTHNKWNKDHIQY